MYLILGLGNPGEQYKNTRHNIGFVIVDKVISNWQFPIFKQNAKFKSQISKGTVDGQAVAVAKPQTFMNESGQAAHALADFYNIVPKNIIIIHDDLDLPLGTIRISYNASSGGHNGVQSCIDHLGTKAFWRVRVGIAGTRRTSTPADVYVLKPFTKSEQTIVKNVIKKAADSLVENLRNEPLVAQTITLVPPPVSPAKQ